MTPERVAFYAEQAWPAGYKETSVRAIESAIRQAVNEALEEAIKACDKHGDDNSYLCEDAIRALKLPEE